MVRPVFALRVSAEPHVDAIKALRAWLKRGLRDHGLRCIDVHEESETKEEVLMPVDLNDALDTLLPPGVYCLEITLVPGKAGEDGYLRLAKNLRSLMLELICKVFGDEHGEYAGYKIWDYITVELIEDDSSLPALDNDKLNKLRTSVRMGRSKLRAILDSAYALQPNDDSDAAKAKRRLNSYGELHGLRFYAQVEQRPARDGFAARNFVDFVVTPDLPDYPGRSTAVVTGPAAPPKRTAAQDLDDEIPFAIMLAPVLYLLLSGGFSL